MQPSKNVVRWWLGGRQESKEPPPSPQEIRENLGWKILKDCKIVWLFSIAPCHLIVNTASPDLSARFIVCFVFVA